MRSPRLAQIALVLGALLIFAAWAPLVVWAHGEGGVLQVGYHPVGSYHVHVWTYPSIVRVGEIHVETLITDAEGAPVTGCDVSVIVTPIDNDGAPLSDRASLTVAGPASEESQFQHQADLLLAEEGLYRVDILVDEAAVRIGQATFELTAERLASWMTLSIYALLGLSGLFGMWLLSRGVRLFWGGRATAV